MEPSRRSGSLSLSVRIEAARTVPGHSDLTAPPARCGSCFWRHVEQAALLEVDGEMVSRAGVLQRVRVRPSLDGRRCDAAKLSVRGSRCAAHPRRKVVGASKPSRHTVCFSSRNPSGRARYPERCEGQSQKSCPPSKRRREIIVPNRQRCRTLARSALRLAPRLSHRSRAIVGRSIIT
jgi:hypothetical protein